MAWITLAIRKQELKAEITNYDDRLLQISREVRKIARHKMTDTSVFNSEKSKKLRDARENYLAIREGRPEDINSEEYSRWQQDYNDAREDYQQAKEYINDEYDGYQEDIEAEASDMQADLEQEQVQTETILASLRAELESVQQQTNEEIKSSAINFGT